MDGWMDEREKVKVGEYARIRVASEGKIRQTSIYYIKKTSSGYKIDWQTSVGINEMTWAAYATQRPDFPVKFRVRTSIDPMNHMSYYLLGENYKEYSRINLKSSWDTSLIGSYGYVRKNSSLGRKIIRYSQGRGRT